MANQNDSGNIMARKFRIAVSVFLGLLTVVLCVLWVRSHSTFDRVSVPLMPHRTLVAISYRGSVTAVVVRITIPEIWRESGRSHPIGTRTPDMIWPRERVLGFGWAYNELMPNVPNAPRPPDDPYGITGRSWHHGGSGVMLPDWFLLFVLLTLVSLPWRSPKFSVRTLMILTALVAVLLTIFSLASRTPEVQWENGTLVTE